MAIDFEKIRTDNIREYGEGTRHLAFLGRLYPDRTHFIYELLQNAEDVKATSVRFSLHQDRLEFEHNGRLFNEADVRGICGVGEGTKTEDLTLIGKFGIGFKSVYAVTNSPEVHSGSDHFMIEHYVRPYGCAEKIPAKGHKTLFIFPFDRDDVEAPVAFDELQESLKNMPTHTILFLKHIKRIQTMINGDEPLTMSKRIAVKHKNGINEVVLNYGKAIREKYLLFSKQVKNSKGLVVEIAYELSKRGRITKSWANDLVVFFPTEKKTHLGFLIQGPYRTTPARDNIPSRDEFNKHLIEITADLMVDSLKWLRDKQLLDENACDLLPVEEVNFPFGSMFRPFYDKLLIAFSSENLLMTDTINSKGAVTFCKSNEIAIARNTEMRQMVSNSMLAELTENQVRYWLNGAITDQTKTTFYRYLKEKLHIKEWRPEDLIMGLTKSFISQRDDEWLIKLYKLILTQRQWIANLNIQKQKPKWDIENRIPFFDKAIVRLQDGTHVKPFKTYTCQETSAFLASLSGTDFPCVKTTILSDPEARSFFEALGYTEPSETEYLIKYILANYEGGRMEQADPSQQINAARQIIEAWDNANKDRRRLIENKLERINWLPTHRFSDYNTMILTKISDCYIANEVTTLFLGGSEAHCHVCEELMDL